MPTIFGSADVLAAQRQAMAVRAAPAKPRPASNSFPRDPADAAYAQALGLSPDIDVEAAKLRALAAGWRAHFLPTAENRQAAAAGRDFVTREEARALGRDPNIAPSAVPDPSLHLGEELDAARFYQVAEFDLVNEKGEVFKAPSPGAVLGPSGVYGIRNNLVEGPFALTQVSPLRYIAAEDIARLFDPQATDASQRYTVKPAVSAVQPDGRIRQTRLVDTASGMPVGLRFDALGRVIDAATGSVVAAKVDRGAFAPSAAEQKALDSRAAEEKARAQRGEVRRRLAGGGSRAATVLTAPLGPDGLGHGSSRRKALLGA